MHPLDIPVKRLGEGPLVVDVDVAPAMLELSEPDFEFRGAVRGQVTFTMVGQDVMATGALEVDAGTQCVRCLAPAAVTVRAAVSEVWMPHKPGAEARPDDEEGEEALVHVYRDDVIEPAEVFRELLLIELPDRPTCSPQCKGLCPGCGADLNREPCRCARGAGRADRPRAESLPEWKRALKNLKL